MVTAQTATDAGGALGRFNYFPGTSMAAVAIPELRAFSADSCARACLSSAGCTSFQWYSTTRVCFTSTTFAPRSAKQGVDLYVLKTLPTTKTTPPNMPGCREGQTVSSCLLDPCLLANCPAFPNSYCIADRCDGCSARFVDKTTVKWIPSCDYPQPKAALSTTKPGAQTTARPAARTTAKPVAQTTAKPVAQATVKPGARTTAKPTGKATIAPRPTIPPPPLTTAALNPANEPLTLKCPINYNVTVPADQGDNVYQYGATLQYAYPFLNKNPPAGMKTYRTGPDSGGVFRLGNNTVTFLMKTDDNSASVSCSFVIWIIVQQDPLLAANMENPGVYNTSTGLQYKVVKKGTGARPTKDDTVVVNYEGKLMDGTVFDSTFGKSPASFQVSKVVPGYSESLMMMQEGGTLEVWIPYYLAYGTQGYPPRIPPSAPLHFTIELVQVKKA